MLGEFQVISPGQGMKNPMIFAWLSVSFLCEARFIFGMVFSICQVARVVNKLACVQTSPISFVARGKGFRVQQRK